MMTLILMGVGAAIGYIAGNMVYGLIGMCAMSVIFGFYSYFFSKSAALRAHKVVMVTAKEEPRLYRIVQKVAMDAGIPMPEVGVSEVYMPNAFATGRGPKDAAVVATRGLLDLLNDTELEGVFAHEISHVKNRDILVMSVASTMAAILSYLSNFAIYAVMFSDGDRDSKLIGYGIAILLSITVPIAALLVQLGVSRSREYLADESAARITKNPRALASALRKLETGCASPKNEYSNNSYASMWISNPVRAKKNIFSSLFSTHPSTEDRIQRLEALENNLY